MTMLLNSDARRIPLAVDLRLGDWRELLPELNGSDDLVFITDPPYGISHPMNYKSRGRSNLAECNEYPESMIEDNAPFDPTPFLSYPCCFFGANHFADRLPASSGWLVWDKARPDTLDQSTCELAWTNYVKGVRRFRYLWNGMMRQGNEKLYHPTQKPLALMKWILGLKWMPEGTVVDPYMGSGTTGVACVQTGRNFIGIEIEPKYFEIAEKRIKEAQLQIRMPL